MIIAAVLVLTHHGCILRPGVARLLILIANAILRTYLNLLMMAMDQVLFLVRIGRLRRLSFVALALASSLHEEVRLN